MLCPCARATVYSLIACSTSRSPVASSTRRETGPCNPTPRRHAVPQRHFQRRGRDLPGVRLHPGQSFGCPRQQRQALDGAPEVVRVFCVLASVLQRPAAPARINFDLGQSYGAVSLYVPMTWSLSWTFPVFHPGSAGDSAVRVRPSIPPSVRARPNAWRASLSNGFAQYYVRCTPEKRIIEDILPRHYTARLVIVAESFV